MRGAGTDGAPGESEPVRAELRPRGTAATSGGLGTSVRVGGDGARERGRSERRRRQWLGAAAPRLGSREGKVRETGQRERMDESRNIWLINFVAEVRRATMTMGSRYMRKQPQPITANGSAIRRQLLVGDVAG